MIRNTFTPLLMPAQFEIVGAWPVDSAYEIVMYGRRPAIRPKSSTNWKLIDPGKEKELVTRFQRVRDEKTLVDFCRRFGLLGYNHMVPREQRWLTEVRAPTGRKEVLDVTVFEPIEWALRHAKNVFVIAAIVGLIKQGPKILTKELQDLLRSNRIDLKSLSEFRGFSAQGRVLAYADWPDNPQGVAWQVIRDLINPVLGGLRLGLVAHSTIPVLRFDALLQVIYLKLIGELENRHLLSCANGGHLFFSKRADSQTCSDKCRVAIWRHKAKKGRRGR